MGKSRYGVKSGGGMVDLINIRRIVRRSGGSVLRYSLALERCAGDEYLVAWQGHYGKDIMAFQQSGETRGEFVKRFETREAIWK